MKLSGTILVILLSLLLTGTLLAPKRHSSSTPPVRVVPLPNRIEQRREGFTLHRQTRILFDPAAEPPAKLLASRLRISTGLDLVMHVEQSAKPAYDIIALRHSRTKANLIPEAYELDVLPNSISITASSPAGWFNGVQTLLQLFPAEIFSPHLVTNIDWIAPCLHIEDQPRFAWRGVLLDVARHFFTIAELKRYIDEISALKINVLQLHLTDDQGWRLQILKHPRLTEIGAWRKSIGFNLDPNSSTSYGPDGRYGGFYTQQEIRDLVGYAQERNVTVLPEIEMPGHAGAALSAYPNLSCSGEPYSTDVARNPAAGVFCASNPETYRFIDEVLSEVAQLFPGAYLHIGGDEVTKENWHQCSRCKALMKREALNSERELQSYFIRKVEEIVSSKGKRLIGWSEILEGGLAQNATVMDWIGGGIQAATNGHDIIMSPTSYCYLDYYQSRNRTNEPPGIGGFLPLKTVYRFDPIPAGLDPAFHKHVLGAQANVWTEYIANLTHVEYMTFPRLCALAEVTWSNPKKRDWDEFIQRLGSYSRRLEAAGVNYRKGFFEQ